MITLAWIFVAIVFATIVVRELVKFERRADEQDVARAVDGVLGMPGTISYLNDVTERVFDCDDVEVRTGTGKAIVVVRLPWLRCLFLSRRRLRLVEAALKRTAVPAGVELEIRIEPPLPKGVRLP